MDQRLEYILSNILPGKGVADIGTDHGFLPVALVKNGYPGRVIASDCNETPLKKAMANAAQAEVSDRIEFFCADGLSAVEPFSVDSVVIAGMGAELICGILDRAPWLQSGEVTLFLQPMSKSEILRYYLCNNGYSILSDVTVMEEGRVYCILTVSYTGANESYSDAELFVGKTPSRTSVAKALRYLAKKPEDGLYGPVKAALQTMYNTMNGT